MNIRSLLPDSKHYVISPFSTETNVVWVDKTSSFFRIVTKKMINPFVGEQKIIVSPRWGKSARTVYLSGIDFKITEDDRECEEVNILREVYKSKAGYSHNPLLMLWAVPTQTTNIWLQYSIKDKEKDG